MNQKIAHRGIRSKVLDLGFVSIGHVRLPIQGLSEDNDQPMVFAGETWMFVGEVFNYRMFHPTAETDLPVLRQLYWSGGLSKADGFWSAAIVNERSRTVRVFSDPLGKKPLYARRRCGQVEAISSEIGPLLDLGTVTPDELYYSSVLKWGYCMLNRTPFQEIRKLTAGATYIFDQVGQLLQYLEPEPIRPEPGDLPTLIEEAVRNRMVSDVPVSVLLSGGLDSTIVFELLKKTGKPFTVYHVDNEESEYLAHLSYPDNVIVKQLDLGDVTTEELVQMNQTPVDLGSVLPQYLLGRAVQSDGCHVALSGDGADELFGGYRRAQDYDSQYSDIFQELIYYHLPRLDKTMMANTVELRSPYLALPVVQHALTIPWSERTSKQALKKAFPWIADQILKRDKKPLRIRRMREKPMEYRKELVRLHREIFFPNQ